jgi:phosphorylcholine metabolism protein LicD
MPTTPDENLTRRKRTGHCRIYSLLPFLFLCLVIYGRNLLFLYNVEFDLTKTKAGRAIPQTLIRSHTIIEAKLQDLLVAFLPLLETHWVTNFLPFQENLKLEYWIDQITLLGAITQNDTLLPNMTTIQLALTRASFDTLARTSAVSLFFSKYTLNFDGNDTGRFLDTSSGLFIQLIAYDDVQDANHLMKPAIKPQLYPECTRYAEDDHAFKIPKDSVFPLAKCMLFNQTVPCPRRSFHILKTLFRDVHDIISNSSRMIYSSNLSISELDGHHNECRRYMQIKAMLRNCVDIPAHDLAFPMVNCWTRQKIQTILQELTTTFISVLQKNSIEFWIDQSTLLGSIVYDKILVPHATSVQLAFTRTSLNALRAKSASFDFPSSKYSLISKGNHVRRFIDIRSGLFVELITYNAIGNVLKPAIKPQICHTCSQTVYTVAKDWVFPLGKCTLLNQSVPCPRQSVHILRQLYRALPCVHLSIGHTIERFRNDHMCWRRHHIQSMLRNLTITLAHLLDAYNLEYWLDSGTLLGQVRHQGLIPHDKDADFGITEQTFKMLSNVPIVDAFPYALDVLNSTVHNYHMRSPSIPARWMDTRSGLYVDIFVFKALNDGKALAPLASGCWVNCAHCEMLHGLPHFVVPRDWIYPLRRCQYENVSVSCPFKPEMYLEKLYGRYFMETDDFFVDRYGDLDEFPYDSVLLHG